MAPNDFHRVSLLPYHYPELQKAVRGHYSRSIKRHLLSTLGSLQALGNPVGLLRGLAQGASGENVLGKVTSCT